MIKLPGAGRPDHLPTLGYAAKFGPVGSESFAAAQAACDLAGLRRLAIPDHPEPLFLMCAKLHGVLHGRRDGDTRVALLVVVAQRVRSDEHALARRAASS